jgi:XTP/dITP diphosphohydrolase
VPLTLLVTSPRIAPGLMSWAAWQAVASADRVLAGSRDLPVARAVTAAGHHVEEAPEASLDHLFGLARDGGVVWLASDEESLTFPPRLAERIVEGGDPPEVEVLHGSYDVPGARLLDLVTVMDRLRTTCPWDREQTHRSLARYLLEEAYETLEAIESGDYRHLREELGDLLLQVYFHARIAAEGEPDGDRFDIDDVAGGIVDKLVHRHPHVFARAADEDPPTREEVDRSWEALKAAEKGRGSVLDGIPLALPALSLAEKVVGRARRVGVEPPATVDGGDAPGEELGDRLLTLVVGARAAGLDAEQELRDAVRRLADRVREAETG